MCQTILTQFLSEGLDKSMIGFDLLLQIGKDVKRQRWFENHGQAIRNFRQNSHPCQSWFVIPFSQSRHATKKQELLGKRKTVQKYMPRALARRKQANRSTLIVTEGYQTAETRLRKKKQDGELSSPKYHVEQERNTEATGKR